jgi:hypothetical protein
MSEKEDRILEFECLDCKEILKIKCAEEDYQHYKKNENFFLFWPERIKQSWYGVGWALEPYTMCNLCYMGRRVLRNYLLSIRKI